MEALTGAWLVRRFVAGRPTMTTLREFVGFLVFAGLLGTLLGALISATGQVLLGMSQTFVKTCGILWGSDMLTTLIVAPFVLAWFSEPPNWRAMIAQPTKLLEGVVLLAGLIAALWWTLVAGPGINSPNKTPSLLFLLWAGLRFGVCGATAVNLLHALLAGFFTQHYLQGLTPADLVSHDYVLTLQAVLAVGTITGLIPAFVLAEHRRTLEALLKSEERTRLFFESQVAGMAVTSPEKGWLQVNDRLCGMLGYTREELQRLTWADLTHAEDLAPNKAQFNRLLRGEINEYVREKRYIRKDGAILHANLSVACVRRRDGSVDYVLALLEDITERKRAEEELQLQSRLQELLMNTSAMYINLPLESVESAIRISLGEIGDFVGADRAAVYNYDFKRNVASLAYEWCREGIESHFADRQMLLLAAYPEWDVEAHRRGESFYIPDVRSLPPGALRDLLTDAGNKSLLAVPITSHEGCIGFVGFVWTRSPHACSGKEQYLLKFFAHILVNVRQRKQEEEALQQSERNYREIYNAATNAIFVHDADTGAILDVNESMLRLYGFSREEALGLTLNDYSLGVSAYSAAEARQWMAKTVAEGPQVFEWQARKKRGELFWVEVALKSATISGQRRILAVVRDITERKRADEALRLREIQLRAILESTGDGILAVDTEGRRVLQSNRRFAELWKIPQSLVDTGDNQALLDFVREQLSDPDAFLKNVLPLYDIHPASLDTLVFKDGRVFERAGFPMLMDGVVIGRVLSFRDITERKQAEEALRESALRHQVILQTAMEGFWVTDLQGRLLEVNAAYCWMSGYSEQELLAMRICDLDADKTPEEVAAHIRNIIEDGLARFESPPRLKYGGARSNPGIAARMEVYLISKPARNSNPTRTDWSFLSATSPSASGPRSASRIPANSCARFPRASNRFGKKSAPLWRAKSTTTLGNC